MNMIILFLDFKLSLIPNMELGELLLGYQSISIPISRKYGIIFIHNSNQIKLCWVPSDLIKL